MMIPIDRCWIFQVYCAREVHEGIIDSPNPHSLFFIAFRDEVLKILFYLFFLLLCEFYIFSSVIVSCKDLLQISIPREIGFSIGEGEDRR